MDTTSVTNQKKSRSVVVNLKGQASSARSTNFPVGAGKSSILSRMKVRKQSFGFGGITGIRSTERRTSQVRVPRRRNMPPLVYLNTYQLEPKTTFRVPDVEAAINGVLDAYWEGHVYNVTESPGLTMVIAGEVMRNVKSLCFDRYRIIAVVSLVQKRSQSYNNAVAFLWDHERDGIADILRETTTAFIQVTVFGVYLD
ncbi:hypothetical protein HF086_009706 [Spodoptera exigua]|uniref:Uncharacterized protein n=1 Tax=Spodoptera exigua TaxID=7107 RepID=A0A922MNT7_SPOEX|nr:hypothetical protein HF086_009706 [Spodoptera exigua]